MTGYYDPSKQAAMFVVSLSGNVHLFQVRPDLARSGQIRRVQCLARLVQHLTFLVFSPWWTLPKKREELWKRHATIIAGAVK